MSIEELKAAYAASGGGEWGHITNDPTEDDDWGYTDPNTHDWVYLHSRVGEIGKNVSVQRFDGPDAERVGKYVALAHNMMPDLIEAVDVLVDSLAVLENGGLVRDESTELLERIANIVEKFK